MSLKKLCPICGKIIPISQSYCDEHLNRQKQYDVNIRYVTDKKYHSFYNSTQWIKEQSYIADKYNNVCLWTLYYEHKLKPYAEVHHIESIRDNWNRRLDTNNLIPLSHSVHMMIEAEYRKGNKLQYQSKLFDILKRYNNEFKSVGV